MCALTASGGMVREMADAPQRPTIVRSAIPFAHWSMKVGRDAPAWGEIVSEIADLEQGIANLIFTPKGSVPTRPEKGCDLIPFMDRPPAIAIPAMTVEIWEGLTAWHPRIRVDEVRVEQLSFERFRAPVFWAPVSGVVEGSLRSDIEITREGLLAVQPAIAA